jgi:PPOX class probable F420-dependent enzyme
MPPSKHVQSRLKKEKVIWLATSGKDGKPQAVPVWFLWDGESFLVYSLPGPKVRDIQANPRVHLHLNTDPEADDVVRVEATAELAAEQPPAYQVPAFVRKYRTLIKKYDWTPKSFADQYNVAIRIRPTRFR